MKLSRWILPVWAAAYFLGVVTAEEQPERRAPERLFFYASKASDVYHRAGCRYLVQIKDENFTVFTTRAAAEEAGKRPCKKCKP